MINIKYKFSLLVSFIFLLTLMSTPGQAYAQWPPFKYSLASSYTDGKITYKIQFSKRVDGAITDVVFKIPLPEGTRFLEAGAPPTTSVDFDGAEITFFTSVLHRPLKDAYFVVEVIDPEKIEYTTHTWIAWKGAQPGDYLTNDVSIDITRTPLNWTKPRSRLRLEVGATAVDDVITYTIYPMNIGGRRMWDLTINMPLPEGTTFLSAEAPPPFETDFDGQQVIFFILELARKAEIAPLRIKVSTKGVTEPFIATQAWATWTNVGRKVAAQEQTKTGDIIIQPHTRQQVVSDAGGDVPISNYDLTSIGFQEDGTSLKTIFYTVGNLGPIGQPIEHYLYLDSDCNAETGSPRGNRGAEYWVRYRHQNGKAYFYTWDAVGSKWSNRKEISAYPTEGKISTIWIPYNLLDFSQQNCWLAVSRNRTKTYHPNPPTEWIGTEARLTRLEAVTATFE